MAKINAINNACGNLTVDPGASGDSFVQFDINTTGEFRIGVDDTDDSFRISQGSALGTNDTFIMSASGERTLPLQPAFNAYNSANDTNVTGNGTVVTVEYDTERFDIGSHYNTSTDIFTAPISGKYAFTATVSFLSLSTASTWNDTSTSIVTSNNTFNCCTSGIYAIGGATDNWGGYGQVYAEMDAADTCYISAFVSGGGQTIGIRGTAGGNHTNFHGSLVN